MKSKTLKNFRRRISKRGFIRRGLDKIYDIFIFEPIWFVKKTYRAIKRFIDYGKVGWNSYEWDHSYLLKLLKFKLVRMKYALENGHSECDKHTTQSLRACVKLLDRLIEDKYNYWSEKNYKKWGRPEFDFVKMTDHPFSDEFGPLHEMVDRRHRDMSEEEILKERDDFMLAIEKDDAHRERDARLLFSIMSKYYTYWWD